MKPLTVGLPLQHKEPGEKRDFLPVFVAWLERFGYQVVLEYGYGAGMGLTELDYRKLAPGIRFASEQEAYAQDYVLVLRYPRDEALAWMRPGARLFSMCHYPTRHQRVNYLLSRGLEAVSLDSIKDDTGRRIVENLKAVGWNGVEVAFQVLQKIYPPPGFESPKRRPIRVTLLGAGAVGGHAIRASVSYGSERLRQRLAVAGVPGVQVTVVDYDLTNQQPFMQELLSHTEILIDATQRPDPSRPVIPNGWIAYLPEYAVLLDLSVDPYNCDSTPAYVKGIEGIPQGNLDQYIFSPDDPAFEDLPECVSNQYRRHVVSCYSWPGVRPADCMLIYGRQIQPLMRIIAEKGGLQNIAPDGTFFERAIARAQLTRWAPENGDQYRNYHPV
jgi:alanine dehydrogenase